MNIYVIIEFDDYNIPNNCKVGEDNTLKWFENKQDAEDYASKLNKEDTKDVNYGVVELDFNEGVMYY